MTEFLEIPNNDVPVSGDVVATALTGESRMEFLPRVFPGRIAGQPGMWWGETVVYALARRLCPAYTGGLWDYFTLSNGGFYMAPNGDEPYHVAWAGNFYSGVLSSDAFGIVCFVFALNAAWDATGDERYIVAMDRLKDFASTHAERQEIFRAID